MNEMRGFLPSRADHFRDKMQIATLEGKLAKSQAEVERLGAALEFYAEQRNYRLTAGDICSDIHPPAHCGIWHRDRDDVGPGARARAALQSPTKCLSYADSYQRMP